MKKGYFYVQELVPKAIFDQFNGQSWQFIQPEIIETINVIREYFNRPVIVNDWMNGGKLEYRGYRPPLYTKNIKNFILSARHSMHYFGAAVDLSVHQMLADEVRGVILSKSHIFPHVKRMEEGVSWVHLDIKETGKDDIVLFGKADEI
jgi:hypothetical protein